MTQPLNKLAPFYVELEEVLTLKVDENGVQVSTLIFPDGSTLTSANSVSNLSNSSDIDSGTY